MSITEKSLEGLTLPLHLANEMDEWIKNTYHHHHSFAPCFFI
jgi:hypothetical protein